MLGRAATPLGSHPGRQGHPVVQQVAKRPGWSVSPAAMAGVRSNHLRPLPAGASRRRLAWDQQTL